MLQAVHPPTGFADGMMNDRGRTEISKRKRIATIIVIICMKSLRSLALILVATKASQAQCDFTFCGGLSNIPDLTNIVNPDDPLAERKSCATL